VDAVPFVCFLLDKNNLANSLIGAKVQILAQATITCGNIPQPESGTSAYSWAQTENQKNELCLCFMP
jgi:hypothetical protein